MPQIINRSISRCTNRFNYYKPEYIQRSMTIFNYNNCKGQPRQLYRIKYSDSTIQKDRELYVLAFDYRSALDMFPPYFNTMKHNPRDIPEGVSEDDDQRATDSILGIERMADVILAIK